MENNQILLWGIGFIILALVVLYALRKGYNVKLKRKDMEASFQKNDKEPTHSHISIGMGMKIQGSKIGDISGIKTKTSGGSPTATSDSSVDVLKNSDIDDSELGDISGIKSEQESKDVPSKS